jgi:hypothetical protein
MRYWMNFLQTVHINDIDTIKELETFIRYPNGTYRKQSDKFYDDRVMSLVWALFMLEPELCGQHFQIDEYDDQNRPLKISSNGYFDVNPDEYIIRDLTTKVIIPNLTDINTNNKYTPLISDNDSYFSDEYDIDSLMSQGWKPLQ